MTVIAGLGFGAAIAMASPPPNPNDPFYRVFCWLSRMAEKIDFATRHRARAIEIRQRQNRADKAAPKLEIGMNFRDPDAFYDYFDSDSTTAK